MADSKVKQIVSKKSFTDRSHKIMKRIIALILAGGRGHAESMIGRVRATASIPFGGKYRIIDFSLSNCVNSGIYTVGVLAQYSPISLMDHIGVGKAWDLDRQNGGVQILQPYLSTGESGWYRGTADAIFQNMDYLENENPEYTLILAGDHVYKMNYRDMIAYHIEKKAPVTMGITRVSREYAKQCGVVEFESEKIVSFEEKPKEPKSDLVSMGIYLFDTEVLLYKLQRIGRDNRFDIVYHVLMEMVNMGEVYGFPFEGYWRDIGSLQDYWRTSMDLIDHPKRLNLYDSQWVIHTVTERKPPVRFGKFSSAINSLVANGCVINGYVEHSILFPGVHIGRGSRVTNSIVMHRSMINDGVLVNHAILDKDVWVGADTRIGWDADSARKEEGAEKVNAELLTVIGKGAIIPSQTTIGQNCKIEPYVKQSDFIQSNIPPGSFIAQRG